MENKLKEIKEEYKSYSDIATNKNSKVLADIQWLVKQLEKCLNETKNK